MPPPKQYREQVPTIYTIQYNGTNHQEIVDWAEGHVVFTDGTLKITLVGGGTEAINNTDWVINDMWDNWWAMSNANFQITYAPGPIAQTKPASNETIPDE
jgi:hypothetical protein